MTETENPLNKLKAYIEKVKTKIVRNGVSVI